VPERVIDVSWHEVVGLQTTIGALRNRQWAHPGGEAFSTSTTNSMKARTLAAGHWRDG